MTKLVATTGPASDPPGVLEKLVKGGLGVMRMNFSHATYEEAAHRLKKLRAAGGSHSHGYYLGEGGNPQFLMNTRAALLDTKGPEIRTGDFIGEVRDLHLETNEKLVITTDEKFKEMDLSSASLEGPKKIFVDYQKLGETVVAGDTILLNDGEIGLEVETVQMLDEAHGQGAEIVCQVMNSGKLGSRKGVNIPGKDPDLPPLTEKDMQDLRWVSRSSL